MAMVTQVFLIPDIGKPNASTHAMDFMIPVLLGIGVDYVSTHFYSFEGLNREEESKVEGLISTSHPYGAVHYFPFPGFGMRSTVVVFGRSLASFTVMNSPVFA